MSHVSPFDWASLFTEEPLIPIWSGARPEVAKSVAQGLIAAGYGVLEVTLREEVAWQVLEQLKTSEITLVAGSVCRPTQLQRLQKLGITLAVAPGWCPELCAEARQLGIRLLPGVATPGEALQAALRGYHEVKLFPALALGGPEYLRALSAPLPEMQFVPTGGVTEASLASWFDLPNVIAAGGSWMLPPDLLERQDWSALEQQARGSLEKAQALKKKH